MSKARRLGCTGSMDTKETLKESFAESKKEKIRPKVA